jgi:hypothetical protein
MGSFRNKFKKFSVSWHYYTVSGAERALTAFLVIGMAPSALTPFVVSGAFIAQSIFLAVNQPYMLGDWKRALLLKGSAVGICVAYFMVNITAEGSSFTIYAPLAIQAVLFLVLIISTVTAVSNIKEHIFDLEVELNSPHTM